MAFRFPGDIRSEAALWDALGHGRDLVTEIPDRRWAKDVHHHPRRAEPGRSVTFSAGVLSRIDEFDAAFFGISPREARQLDPQQRQLLEMAWEAMENAGQAPEDLAGSDCGVYIGISGLDYGLRSIDDLASIDAYSMTGNTLSIAANRLSYVFNLHGPSMAIDTACSSSMVALHQACQSLRTGESGMALVGGINLLLHPYPFVGFTKASMLSASGRCKTFDTEGDGYVRSEGGAVLLLKPYERALADGDPIHAVILATGVNTDGYKSGITIPSAAAQARLMRQVCDQAGISPRDIVYVEAHGTGTAVGDPIETAAIGEAIGHHKAGQQPLYIGSVKSNMGHLEPASGMAGLIKTVLCLKHRALPASLHMTTANPNIDFAGLNLAPVTQLIPLPETETPLRMGVNSFGFGGANAHALLEEGPRRPEPTGSTGEAVPPLFISARHPDALKALAEQYAEVIGAAEASDYYDLAASTAFRRQRLEHRLAVLGETPAEIAAQLHRFAAGEMPAGTVVEDVLTGTAKLAFVYSGNGAQWIGMGRRLLQESALFRDTVTEIDALLLPLAGFSLIEELALPAEASRLHLTEVAQPALFAMQVGLTRLVRSLGLDATAAMGHSVGEVAAAWATGALDLAQAVRVIHERSASQATTQGCGRMAAVALAAEQAAAILAETGLEAEVVIAGFNSPNQVTLSGSLDGLMRLSERLKPQGTFFRLLDLDYAFHSPHMAPIRDRVLTDLADLTPQQGTGRFCSSVSGDFLAGDRLDADYWWQNIRQPVRFADAMASLIKEGYTVFLEISPHAILQRYIGECQQAAKATGRALALSKRDEESLARVTETAFRAYLLGCPLDLARIFPHDYRFVAPPAYPWQREHHWYQRTSEGYRLIERYRVHPLLGYRLKDAEAAWENPLDTETLPYLRDHVVGGAVVLPAAAYAELALAASREHFGGERHEIEELEIRLPILLDGEHARMIRFEIDPRDGGFQIKSRPRLSDEAWSVNAVGRLLGAPLAAPPAPETPSDWLADAGPTVSGEDHYRDCRALGLEYGPAFQGFEAAWPRDGELLAALRLPDAAGDQADAHLLHPALSDTGFQTLLALFSEEIRAGHRATLLPVRIGRLRLLGRGEQVRYCHTRVVRRSPHSVLADFRLLDASGATVAELTGCRFRGAPIAGQQHGQAAEWVYTAWLKPRRTDYEASPIPDRTTLRQAIDEAFRRDEPVLRRQAHFESVLPLFDALVSAFAHQACLALADADRRLPDDFAVSGPADLQSLRAWLLALLEEDGLAERAESGWLLAEPGDVAAEDIWLAVLGDNPAYMPDLLLAGRVGLHLSALLAGAASPEAWARAPGSDTLMEQWFKASPSHLGSLRLVAALVRRIVAGWPEQRRLRILEVGRGTRALTRAVLPQLPADRFDYVIAETDDDSLARAESEFADLDAVSCRKLDPVSLALDGLDGPGFDLVLVDHLPTTVGDPLLALAALKQTLNAGGLLALLANAPDRLTQFTFALTPGGGTVTAAPEHWEGLFEQAGYETVETLLEPAPANHAAGIYAVLARTPVANGTPVDQPAEAAWLLVADPAGESRVFAEDLAGRLRTEGQTTVLASPNALPELAGFQHVVHLAGLTVREDESATDLMAVQQRRCLTALELAHRLASQAAPARLWLATGRGAVVTGPEGQPTGDRLVPSQAALWGFGRVLMNEQPDLHCTLVDLRFDHLDASVAVSLAQELLHPDGEDEVMLSPRRRQVTRMRRLAIKPDLAASETDRISLDFSVPGQLRNLAWRRDPGRPPADDEIEIRPLATGLNFRDVMYAMGLLSDEAVENGFSGPTMGMELAGEVTRVGARVSEFQPGDPVIAFAPAGFANRVVTKATSAVLKPADWTFEEAATVPTVFFTVYYALVHLARLQPGERILIHGAAGGVGIAAIQMARHLGAEIFATAGSDEKRDFARLLGAHHVMNSRNLAFADDILAITGGQGVDVVLNSLAGEAINRNFRVLRPFGRFLELGKRDFYENTRIGLRPFKDNITYYGIDADQLMVERPELTTRLFRDMMALFEAGALRPLPHRVFPAERMVDAFRYMQQARQIGKIVVSFAGGTPAPTLGVAGPVSPAFERNGTYLVTGGLGGFGLQTARWLAEHGAGHLVLLSRRGPEAPEAETARAELAAAGAQAHILACDVSDAGQLAEVLATMGRELPPLKGIVHAAMVLDDGLIQNLDAARFNAVLQPKMLGAWHLHELTAGLPLDFFVVYSSATTFIGNPGQANYVAANLYLEALVAHRRAMGLPGTSVCWGAIGDVGYLARNEDIKDALQSRLGGAPLKSEQALARLGDMLATGRTGIAIMDFDWHALSRFLQATASPRFDDPRRRAGKAAESTDAGDIHALIAGHSEDEVRDILRQLLTDEIAQILRLPADRIPPDRSLYDIGMDSLMGVELVLGIEKRFGINLPVMALSEGPTIERISERLLRELLHGGEGNEDDDNPTLATLSSMAAQHGVEVSQDELAETASELKSLTSRSERVR